MELLARRGPLVPGLRLRHGRQPRLEPGLGGALCEKRSIRLRDRASGFFTEAGEDLFRRSVGRPAMPTARSWMHLPRSAMRHLQSIGRGPLKRGQTQAAQRALGLMEMQRSLLSCTPAAPGSSTTSRVWKAHRPATRGPRHGCLALARRPSAGKRVPDHSGARQEATSPPSAQAPTFSAGVQARVTQPRAVARAAFASLASSPATPATGSAPARYRNRSRARARPG